jgi:N-acylneuraminate cytidylyltransferase
MISGKSVLAIIPAKGNSRRCPDKNISLYKNKSTGEFDSLIGWAIKHAQGSKYIDSIAIASDSDQILTYAKPPIIPVRLPPFIASGSSEAAITFCLYSITQLGETHIGHHDLFCLLQPTSPLRTPTDIDACLEIASASSHPCVSVTPSGIRNGAVYAFHTLPFLSSLALGGAQHHVMPTERSLDIDLPTDFSL